MAEEGKEETSIEGKNLPLFMAEDGKEEKGSPESPKPSFVEVFCKNSGKFRRFAAGTTAGFALYVINIKLRTKLPRPMYIEAIKDGEESVTFGPSAVLVNYGEGWKLKTAIIGDKAVQSDETSDHLSDPSLKSSRGGSSTINRQYILKILVAFIFIFFLGGLFTFLLEYLPQIIVSATSYL